MVSRLSALLSAGLLIVMSNAAVAESGIASIYPHSYKGRRTASGQPFNPGAMTCAHRRHAFGTSLRVTAGGKSIVVPLKDGWYEHVMNCAEYAMRNFGQGQQTVAQMARHAAKRHNTELRRSQQDRDPYDKTRRASIPVGRGGY